MGHFAKVENGIVTQVIVAEQDVIDSGLFGTGWIQTSYNTRGGIHYGQDGKPDDGIALRANYAGIGHTYDAENDVFYAPTPYPSWLISTPKWTWQSPVPLPSDAGTGEPPKAYGWDETIKNWIEL